MHTGIAKMIGHGLTHTSDPDRRPGRDRARDARRAKRRERQAWHREASLYLGRVAS